MTIKTATARLAALGALCALGCYGGNLHPRGEVGDRYGEAKRAAAAQMVADPLAGERNREPVLGLDAQSAESVGENYRQNEQAEVQERKLRDRSLIQLVR
jgi:hypothetical protein